MFPPDFAVFFPHRIPGSPKIDTYVVFGVRTEAGISRRDKDRREVAYAETQKKMFMFQTNAS